MTLRIIGLNHHNASLDYREKLAFSHEEIQSCLKDLIASDEIKEAVILSTCNRTEFYLQANEEGEEYTKTWLKKNKNINKNTEDLLFSLKGEKAIIHLSRVACGLDSMILGEPQILGQLKNAYKSSVELGAITKDFSKLFDHIFRLAKKIRTNTNISNSPVSVSYAAVILANQFFSRLDNHSALLIGAGEAIELVAKHLVNKKIDKLFIANRNINKAQELAKRYGGYALDLDSLDGVIEIADLILSSTASDHYILKKFQIQKAIKNRKRKPIFAVDMAVPRDLDPEIQEIEDIYLYTIDDLEKVVLEGQNKRNLAAVEADEIIIKETIKYSNTKKAEEVEPMIIELREYGESIKNEVLEQSIKQIKKGDDIEAIIEKNASLMINKLLHNPSVKIREAAENSDQGFIDNVIELFNLKKK